MEYPIVTHDKTRRDITLNGRTMTVEETVTRDYGPEGTTTSYIQAPESCMVEICGTEGIECGREKAVRHEMLNDVLKEKGYRLKV